MSWYTAKELARLDLPGLPNTQQNMKRRAHSEEWVSRPRRARGGGDEYHISSLPEVARIALARRAVNADAPYVAQRDDATFTPCVRGKRNRGQARLYVVNLFRVFADAASLQGGHARAAFCHLYNNPSKEAAAAGDVEIPEWVRDYVYRVNARTLESWVRKAKREGIEALEGKYGHRKGSGTIDSQPAMRDFAATQCETRPQLTANQLMRAIETQFGETLPKRTVQRWMATFKEENAAHLLSLHDPDKHKSKFRSAFGSSSENVVALNQIWEIDATPADVMTVEEDGSRRRMNITGVIDVYSRRVKVLVTETPRAVAASGVIRKAILEWGVPDTLKTDNGKDFVSAHFTRGLADLSIRHQLCPPFTPEGKPHIERFFGTMARDLLALLPGFVGHSVADRKSIEARRSFAQRFGSSDQVLDVQLSGEELQQICDSWIETQYEREPHAGLNGKSPFETAMQWTGGIQAVRDERILDTMLMEAPDKDGIRVVGKKGIHVERAAFIAPELGPLVGSRVHVRLDPCDMGFIHVYAMDGAFICVAECPERSGGDRRQIAVDALKRQREVLNEGRVDARRRARKYKPHLLADRLREESARRADTVLAFPKTTTPHDTPATRAAEDNLRAMSGDIEEQHVSAEDEALAAQAFADLEAKDAEIVRIQDARFAGDPEPDGNGYEWVMWAQRHRDQLNETDRKFLEEEEADPEMQLLLTIAKDLTS
ncbi:Mu transposase C-terminal domain-containing protein [Pyruvatibacter sp.]|uniref:Mu transposase C-terminal domain-containing protein n=1 Tax=Pyruvatibacter sp. TaxID=1981328 RepID=UPI0032EAD127